MNIIKLPGTYAFSKSSLYFFIDHIGKSLMFDTAFIQDSNKIADEYY